MNEEHKNKISKALKGKMPKNFKSLHTPEMNKKRSITLKGISTRGRGWKVSEETKRKMSENRKGFKHLEKTKKQMSKSHTGKIMSEEAKKKISENNAYYWLEKKRPLFSKKWKKKIGDAHRGEKNYRWKGGRENTLMLNRKRRALKLNAEGSHTLQEWEDLKKKYNYMCLCCKQQEPFIKLTEDHIIPLTRGGSNYIDNIQPLCGSCNSRKFTNIINYILQYDTIF